MSNDAAALVAGAKEWATLYGDYSNGEEGAVLTAPLRFRAAWAANDSGALADMFVENGSFLAGDRQLMNREEIRSYMAEAFAGGLKGSRMVTDVREIRMLTDSVAIAITDGGIIPDGQESLGDADRIRIMWVAVKQDGDWRLASYQSSPVTG
ncbi:SgcJ/EcaC family oxidoreductase [Micromonospora echinofusca]|uniref:SgcJ/EcaC family oxidoreductase n=1 Tax=Micromonospora echinofusca TaxID=47858 RepID=UPI00343B16B5